MRSFESTEKLGPDQICILKRPFQQLFGDQTGKGRCRYSNEKGIPVSEARGEGSVKGSVKMGSGGTWELF